LHFPQVNFFLIRWMPTLARREITPKVLLN
jgi:hypothetical protein